MNQHKMEANLGQNLLEMRQFIDYQQQQMTKMQQAALAEIADEPNGITGKRVKTFSGNPARMQR